MEGMMADNVALATIVFNEAQKSVYMDIRLYLITERPSLLHSVMDVLLLFMYYISQMLR